MEYEPVIGLEVHVQMETKTKAFCGCSTEFGQPANTQTCPVCLGFPGVLPVLNETFLQYAMRTALALNCTVANYLKFDRKHYYYPDLPKNYQISQYDMPLAAKGYLDTETENGTKKIRIRRVHLEEDAGKLMHGEKASLVDYNRSGMPLLEIVTEPDINSEAEAYAYLTQLKSILEYLEVSDCDMEKGSLRCDANISLRPKGQTGLGVKTELKNMNSFKGVRDALCYEIERQTKKLESGGKIIQETRLWDAEKEKTFTMRTKEEAHDYRYFPEPDLVPFTISDETIETVKNELPELPAQKKMRLEKEYGLCEYDGAVISADKYLASYFEAVAKKYKTPKTVANWLMGDIMNYLKANQTEPKELKNILPPESLFELLVLIDDGTASGKIAKMILPEMLKTGKKPQVILNEQNLSQLSDTRQLEVVIDEVIKENPKVIQDFKTGKSNALMFLMGQVMKKTKGQANPQLVTSIIKEKLDIKT